MSLAFLLGAAALARGISGTVLRWTAVALFIALLVASALTVQRRLYDVGHDRDPNAPISAVKDFTPRLIGPTKVGNFTVWSFPHVGGFALVIAMAMAVTGAGRSLRRARS
jgi:hypothetical protein